MNYISTRDCTVAKSASQAILQGISEEGGLFVPQSFPQIDHSFVETLVHMDYIQRAKAVMGLYLSDFSEEQLTVCAESAYRDTFATTHPAPVAAVGDLHFLELWHGPTCAFKDMALQILPHLMAASRQNTGDTRTGVVLVATSGDTGKAALDGFADVAGTKILVFYPSEGVSAIQKLQMATQQGENVGVQAIHGNFDHCQSGVKEIFASSETKAKLAEQGMYLTSANSINWGRLLPQVVYYFSAYADLVQQGKIALGDVVNICVPTGNFGNILAGYYAKKMGLPLGKFLCASNQNDVLTEFINTGVYNKQRPFYTTNTPSMDILISSNLERFLFDMLGQDSAATADLMHHLKEDGRYQIDQQVLEKVQEEMCGYHCDEAETLRVIAELHARYGYVCDPHTAVAVSAYEQYQAESGDTRPTIIVSTASPYKFADSVLEGMGVACPTNEFEALDVLCASSGLAKPEQLAALQQKAVRFTSVIDPAQMTDAVYELLGVTGR